MKMKYVAYIRTKDASDIEVEKQRLSIDEYAKNNNINISKYYIDDGYSSMNFDRPELKQMLRDVKSKNITAGIIVKDIKRIAKENILLNEFAHKISRNNVELISTIDGETTMMKITNILIEMFKKDQLSRKKMSQKFIDEQIRKGKCVVIPYERNSDEDIEIRLKELNRAKKEGIKNIRFVNRPQKKKGKVNER